jgi:hypothetical protein
MHNWEWKKIARGRAHGMREEKPEKDLGKKE